MPCGERSWAPHLPLIVPRPRPAQEEAVPAGRAALARCALPRHTLKGRPILGHVERHAVDLLLQGGVRRGLRLGRRRAHPCAQAAATTQQTIRLSSVEAVPLCSAVKHSSAEESCYKNMRGAMPCCGAAEPHLTAAAAAAGAWSAWAAAGCSPWARAGAGRRAAAWAARWHAQSRG